MTPARSERSQADSREPVPLAQRLLRGVLAVGDTRWSPPRRPADTSTDRRAPASARRVQARGYRGRGPGLSARSMNRESPTRRPSHAAARRGLTWRTPRRPPPPGAAWARGIRVSTRTAWPRPARRHVSQSAGAAREESAALGGLSQMLGAASASTPTSTGSRNIRPQRICAASLKGEHAAHPVLGAPLLTGSRHLPRRSDDLRRRRRDAEAAPRRRARPRDLVSCVAPGPCHRRVKGAPARPSVVRREARKRHSTSWAFVARQRSDVMTGPSLVSPLSLRPVTVQSRMNRERLNGARRTLSHDGEPAQQGTPQR